MANVADKLSPELPSADRILAAAQLLPSRHPWARQKVAFAGPRHGTKAGGADLGSPSATLGGFAPKLFAQTQLTCIANMHPNDALPGEMLMNL